MNNNISLSEIQKDLLINYFFNLVDKEGEEQGEQLVKSTNEAQLYLSDLEKYWAIYDPKTKKSDDEIENILKKADERIEKKSENNIVTKKEKTSENKAKKLFNIRNYSIAAVFIILFAFSYYLGHSNLDSNQTKKETYLAGEIDLKSGMKLVVSENSKYLLNEKQDSLLIESGRVYVETKGLLFHIGVKDHPYISITPKGTKYTVIKSDSLIELAVLNGIVVFSDSKNNTRIENLKKLSYSLSDRKIVKIDSINVNYFAQDNIIYTIKEGFIDTTSLKTAFKFNERTINNIMRKRYTNAIIKKSLVIKNIEGRDTTYSFLTEEGNIVEVSKNKIIQVSNFAKNPDKVIFQEDISFVDKTLREATQEISDKFGIDFMLFPEELVGKERINFSGKKGTQLKSFVQIIDIDDRFNIVKQKRGFIITLAK